MTIPQILGRKKALLIAIQDVHPKHGSSEFRDLHQLPFAHRDAEKLRDLLIASRGYLPDDIVLMKDDRDHPRHLWPTKANILQQIDQLTDGAPEHGHIFFYFSGHGVEEESHDQASTRANGQDNDIVSADGRRISEHDLHKHLIDPLDKVKGLKLFALFDCCHSETLLDLQVGAQPNHYDRKWQYGRGQLLKTIVHTLIVFSELSKKHTRADRVVQRRASIKLCSPRVPSPHEVDGLSVICLAACRDTQFAHDIGGQTFTKCFLEAAAGRPNITWTELHDQLKDSVSKIREQWEAILHKLCPQEPRYSTNIHVDLNRVISL